MASAVSPTSKPDPWRRRTIVVGLAVLVLVVVVSAGVLINRVLTPASTSQGPHFPGQPLHDALGLFTVTTPPGWKVTGGAQPPDTYCAEIGGINPCIEHYVFQDQQPGDTVATVTIDVDVAIIPPIPTVVYCPTAIPTSTTAVYGGVPTTVDGLPAGWGPNGLGEQVKFVTLNASFIITTFVPLRPYSGDSLVAGPPHPPVADGARVEAQAQAIIDSIQVTDHTSCT